MGFCFSNKDEITARSVYCYCFERNCLPLGNVQNSAILSATRAITASVWEKSIQGDFPYLRTLYLYPRFNLLISLEETTTNLSYPVFIMCSEETGLTMFARSALPAAFKSTEYTSTPALLRDLLGRSAPGKVDPAETVIRYFEAPARYCTLKRISFARIRA